MTQGRRRRVDNIPEGQPAIVGMNIRTLRQRKGWSQAKLGELMGWQSASTVCAAEGRRDGRQRGFTAREIERLAAIFGISPPSAHDAVREVQRSSSGRVRLPGMRNRDRRLPPDRHRVISDRSHPMS
jgi:transcriptional regulator with XRE-family HTH domain